MKSVEPDEQQEHVITMFLSGRRQAEAAEVAAVTKATASQWKREGPAFVVALNARHKEAWGVRYQGLKILKWDRARPVTGAWTLPPRPVPVGNVES